MTLSELIYSIAQASSPLTAQIGTRLYPSLIPAGSDQLPAVVYRAVSAVANQDGDGPSKLDHFTIDMWVYAHTKKQAEQVAALLRAAMDGYKTSPVAYIQFQTQGDDWLSERRAYVVSHEYRITLNR
jgi:hypothetical protein